MLRVGADVATELGDGFEQFALLRVRFLNVFQPELDVVNGL